MTANQKGAQLEVTVEWIESLILHSSPALKGKTQLVERRKVICEGDVHHEIDIYVTVAIAKGYDAIFVFECKNWKEPVGKNEIVNFSEKIKASRAQTGYFVAKAYTKDAQAQAKKDSRITLLQAVERETGPIDLPNHFHVLIRKQPQATLVFSVFDKQGGDPIPLDVQYTTFELFGEVHSLQLYVNDWIEELYLAKISPLLTAELVSGAHIISEMDERSYPESTCIVNCLPIANIRLEATYAFEVLRPEVFSDIEVQSRGRAILLERIQKPEFGLDISFVRVEPQD